MNMQDNEFDGLKQKTLEIIYEIESLNSHESLLRECKSVESNRADAKSAEREAARQATAEARANTAAVSAVANRTLTEYTALSGDLIAAKMQLGIIERERSLLEKRCSELSFRADSLQQELQRLLPVQTARKALQQSYTDLEGQMKRAIDEAQAEQLRLQDEIRRVQDSVADGVELRARACRAAAANARERRFAQVELKKATEELQKANDEIVHLKAALTQKQKQGSDLNKEDSIMKALVDERELVVELWTELATEKAETARLELALSALLADNATLAGQLATIDNRNAPVSDNTSSPLIVPTNMAAVDSFLNEL